MNGGIAVQLAVDSLAAASLYAIVATAVALAYSGSGTVHLAIGQVGAAAVLASAALLSGNVPAWLAIPAGLLVGGVLSAGAERGLVAPALGRPLLAAALLVAAAVVLQELLLALFPHPAYAFPIAGGALHVLGGVVHAYDLLTIGVVAATAAGGYALLRSGRVGAALRLTAAAPAMAERIGVDTATVRTVSFAAGGVLAAAAAMLAAARFPVSAGAGGAVLVALRGIAAAAGGGMRLPLRIAAAAALIGAGEVVGQYFLGSGGEFVADAAAVLVVVAGWRR
ncbi:MAG: hypothetical protein JOY68_07060 [Candidatus Dormibacteraeota bacterium]|nr:hypothetical protein [Candidatus Dormibacteraeota bacterium]